VALTRVRRVPRLAIIVVAAGLFFSALSPLVYKDATYGGELDWVSSDPIPNSAPAPFGAGGSARIQAATISATEPNAAGYTLYRIAATLAIKEPRMAPARDATCTQATPSESIVGRTENRRAAYPRPSDNLVAQDVPRTIVVQFAALGGETVGVRLSDAFGKYAIGATGTLEWAPFEEDHQTYLWRLQDPGSTVKLRFASLWRTTGERLADIDCNLGHDVARVRTSTGGF
jgi:hypothetical protein